jgi:hypothetical protein
MQCVTALSGAQALDPSATARWAAAAAEASAAALPDKPARCKKQRKPFRPGILSDATGLRQRVADGLKRVEPGFICELMALS